MGEMLLLSVVMTPESRLMGSLASRPEDEVLSPLISPPPPPPLMRPPLANLDWLLLLDTLLVVVEGVAS